jgi:ATP-dependent Lon protease
MPKDERNQRRKEEKKNRRRKGHHGDHDSDSDESVDSRGNLRNLIVYESESESEYEKEEKCKIRPPRRKSAILAQKKIKQIAKKSTLPTKRSPINKKTRSQPVVHYPTVRRNPKYMLQTQSETQSPSSIREQQRYFEEEEEEEEEEIESGDETEESDEMEYVESDSSESSATHTPSCTEEDQEEEDLESDEEEPPQRSRIGNILLALMGGGKNNMAPQKHSMTKESDNVKRFVKLLTTPVEENTIDQQIDQFKELTEEKQRDMILALEKRNMKSEQGMDLMLKILILDLPAEIKGMILAKYTSLQSLDTSSNEYFKLRAWLEKVVSIPFGTYKEIPARLEDGQERCSDFMKQAKKCLDEAVYGQEDAKLQIMQFIGTKIANPRGRGLSLLFVGPPGVGKTSLIKNGIAKALGWPFQFISLGGDSDASTYTGHQLVYESSHCGKIVNSLVASKSMSTVLMFDEIDKISQTPKGEEVMNLLIHLTDPVQNGDFEDKYLSGIPIDLSRVMFVFSANDIHKIDRILLDRMIVVKLDGYDQKQKAVIAEQYLLPEALKEVNLMEKIAISKEILQLIIQEFAGDEKGVRELKRCIDQVVQKINMLRLYNSPDLPFYIKEFALPFIVKKDHVRLFLKKKEEEDLPPHGMYL